MHYKLSSLRRRPRELWDIGRPTIFYMQGNFVHAHHERVRFNSSKRNQEQYENVNLIIPLEYDYYRAAAYTLPEFWQFSCFAVFLIAYHIRRFWFGPSHSIQTKSRSLWPVYICTNRYSIYTHSSASKAIALACFTVMQEHGLRKYRRDIIILLPYNTQDILPASQMLPPCSILHLYTRDQSSSMAWLYAPRS